MLDLMPSRQLIAHEWEKHGTCTGLAATDYFARIRQAYGAVHLPPALVNPAQPVRATAERIEQLFGEANPGLTPEMMAVECKKFVSEVRVCLDKDLHFRRCGRDVANACRGETIFPPVR
jgi:ribonuclease T2